MRFSYYVGFGILAMAGVAGAVLALVGPTPRGAKTPAPPAAALAAAPPSTPAPLADLGPKVRLVKGGWTGSAPTTRVDSTSGEPAAPADGPTGSAGSQPAAGVGSAGVASAGVAGAGPAGAGQPIALMPVGTVDAASAPATTVALTTPRDDPAGTTPDRKLAVDINTASVEELNALPGGGLIGRAIVRGRPYQSVDDLQAKRILTRDTLERIRPHIAAQ